MLVMFAHVRNNHALQLHHSVQVSIIRVIVCGIDGNLIVIERAKVHSSSGSMEVPIEIDEHPLETVFDKQKTTGT